MLAEDLPRLRESLMACMEALGGRQVSEAALSVWYSALKGYHLHEAADGIEEWSRTRTKAPAPADIVGLLSDRRSARAERMAQVTKAEQAVEVQRFIRTPEGQRVLRELRSTIKATPKRGRDVAWAYRIIDRYVDGDVTLSACTVRFALEAVGWSREDVASLKAGGRA